VEVLLEKFREKKPAAVQALKDAIDAVYCTVCMSVVLFMLPYDAVTLVKRLIVWWVFYHVMLSVLVVCLSVCVFDD